MKGLRVAIIWQVFLRCSKTMSELFLVDFILRKKELSDTSVAPMFHFCTSMQINTVQQQVMSLFTFQTTIRLVQWPYIKYIPYLIRLSIADCEHKTLLACTSRKILALKRKKSSNKRNIASTVRKFDFHLSKSRHYTRYPVLKHQHHVKNSFS